MDKNSLQIFRKNGWEQGEGIHKSVIHKYVSVIN